MATTFIRIWYKSGGRWFYETYNTTDTSWRESFLILKATGEPVKLQYVDQDREADLGSPQAVSLLS
jgi:hypothetical protein